MKENPQVFEWLRNRSKRVINLHCLLLRHFCEYTKITPLKFLMLQPKQARDLLCEYIDSFKMTKPRKALVTQNATNSFYFFHNEVKLPFIPEKHKIIVERKRLREHMTKEVCWRIINKAKDLRDECILKMVYESGVRENVLHHMNVGHIKHFHWFIIKNGEVLAVQKNSHMTIPSEADIAMFEVHSQPSKEFTHDNKLRGKTPSYFAGLHREAVAILKQYMEMYHKNSSYETPLFQCQRSRGARYKKGDRLGQTAFLDIAKNCAERAGLDPAKINFHAMRRGFRNVVRNTIAIGDDEYKETLAGHKVSEVRLAYFDQLPLELAREYSKCDFSMPSELAMQLQKELVELKVREKPELSKLEDEWYRQYTKDMAAIEPQQPQHIPVVKEEPQPTPPPQARAKIETRKLPELA